MTYDEKQNQTRFCTQVNLVRKLEDFRLEL